jgi:hypothetical protein
MTPLPGPAITATPIIGSPSSADVTTPLTLTEFCAHRDVPQMADNNIVRISL